MQKKNLETVNNTVAWQNHQAIFNKFNLIHIVR